MDPTTRHYWKTPLRTVADIMDAFENITDDIECPSDIFLEPPEYMNETDEDSGDEQDTNPNLFSTNQLLAGVEVRFNNEQDDEFENESPNENEQTVKSTEPEASTPHVRVNQKWVLGNEDNLPLSANMYRFEAWNDTYIPPLTLSADSDAIEFFQLFITSSFVDLVAKQTTHYAATKKNKAIQIDADDIYAFMGVMIVSGYNMLPRRRLYWATDQDTRNELISKWMRRPTFENIFTNIHFCDVDSIGSTADRFVKIRPFIDHLNDVFQKYAPIQMNVSVDESMIPYYGRHPCKQFIRNKPIRFGYKAWVAASTAGYCYLFDVYQGRNQKRDGNLGLGESVVLNFAQQMKSNFPDRPLSFYFDNFFTGPNLVCALNQINFAATGTVRENRLKNIEFSDKKIMNKKPRGYFENFVDKKNELILTRWKDNRTVSMLSNLYGKHPVGTSRRYVHAELAKMDIPRPAVVKQYNKNMGGVDIMDRHISNYRMNIRGKKFYMPVVLWMMDLAVSNSWSLAKHYGLKLNQLEFRRQLAVSLLTRYGKPLSQGKILKKPSFLSKGAHTSVRSTTRLRCKHCHSQTTYKCSSCGIALHTKCSAEFHSQIN